MIPGMTQKIAVSLPDDVANYLRSQPNASATVATAVRAHMTGESTRQMLREAGFVLTEEGRAKWRERLRRPIPPEVIEAGRRMLEQVDRPPAPEPHRAT
jgi:hypothetical protein